MKSYLGVICGLVILAAIGFFAFSQLVKEGKPESGNTVAATPSASILSVAEPTQAGSQKGVTSNPPASSNAPEDENQKSIGEQAKSSETEEDSGQSVHPLTPVLELARQIRTHIQDDVRDYTAILVKRERNKGKLMPEERMELKVRNGSDGAEGGGEPTPLSAYMKFLAPPSAKGREVIWVEGQNDNNIIVHEGGFKNLLRLTLDPNGMLAMRGNKYPATEIGLLRLTEKLIEKGERDRALGDCKVEIIAGQKVGDRTCRVIQVTHPEKKEGFDFHVAQIFVDDERQLPLRYAAFMWPEKAGEEPPLEEEYTYLDLKVNVGLSDSDFDPDNEAYNYP